MPRTTCACLVSSPLSPVSNQISASGVSVSVNFPDIEPTLGQCFLCLRQGIKRTLCRDRTRFRYGGRLTDYKRSSFRPCARGCRRDGCLEKPLGSLLPAFASNPRNVRPQAINGQHHPLLLQPATDGFQALAVIKGILYFRPHCPQLTRLRKWLFSTPCRKVPPCTSYPLVVPTVKLIVFHR